MKTISEQARPRSIPPFKWTPELMRVNNKHPLAVKSRSWPEIARLANSGDIDGAMELAASTERTADTIFRAKITRRARVERVAYFTLLNKADRELRNLLNLAGDKIANFVAKHSYTPGGLKRINDRIHDMNIELRSFLRSWLNAQVRETTRLSFRIKGDTLAPIFKQSRESVMNPVMEMILLEAAKKIIISARVASKDPTVKLSKPGWKRAQKKVLKSVLKKNVTLLNPSQRIWNMTQDNERAMKSIVANGISRGDGAAKIGNNIKKFVSPKLVKKIQADLPVGRGVSRNLYSNARRLAITETNRAYAKASGEYAKSKEWITGKQFHVSTAHTGIDICDRWNGVIVTVDEYNAMVDSGQFPFHPHCRCYDTDVVDEKFLEKEDAA